MNKNTRKRKMSKAARKACRMTSKSEDVCVSQNTRRNMEMRLLRWTDATTGKKGTKTVHCKISETREARPKPRRDIKLQRGRPFQEQPAGPDVAGAELAVAKASPKAE